MTFSIWENWNSAEKPADFRECWKKWFYEFPMIWKLHILFKFNWNVCEWIGFISTYQLTECNWVILWEFAFYELFSNDRNWLDSGLWSQWMTYESLNHCYFIWQLFDPICFVCYLISFNWKISEWKFNEFASELSVHILNEIGFSFPPDCSPFYSFVNRIF